MRCSERVRSILDSSTCVSRSPSFINQYTGFIAPVFLVLHGTTIVHRASCLFYLMSRRGGFTLNTYAMAAMAAEKFSQRYSYSIQSFLTAKSLESWSSCRSINPCQIVNGVKFMQPPAESSVHQPFKFFQSDPSRSTLHSGGPIVPKISGKLVIPNIN